MARGLGVTLLEASHLHTDRQIDRQVLTLYCEFDLGGQGFGSYPVGSLTPIHRHTDRQTDGQVLTLYCEFDLGGEGFGGHPVGSLTPVHSLVVVWSDGKDEFILRFAEAALVREVDLLIVLVPEAKRGDTC